MTKRIGQYPYEFRISEMKTPSQRNFQLTCTFSCAIMQTYWHIKSRYKSSYASHFKNYN